MKKLLFFAYYFPPTGGAGVQRAVKFVKYLPEFGYKCAVLSSGEETFKYNLKEDQTLGEKIDAEIFRIKLNKSEQKHSKLYPSALKRYMPGITMKWWKSSAQRSMQEAIDKFEPEVIMVTVSPFMAAEVTMEVAAKNNIPWVLDMRDPWALDPINFYSSKLHYLSDLKKMKKACLNATAVIMNTPNSLRYLKKAFPEVDPHKCFCVTNGWDSDDFENFDTTEDTDTATALKIVHTGLFHTNYAQKVDPSSRKILTGKGKNLMDYLRYNSGKTHLLARTPYYLFQAAKNLIDSGRITKNDLLFTFAGVASPADKKLSGLFDMSDIVKWTGYLGHNRSIHLLKNADVLFLPLHICRNGQPLIVPGKTYEYMAAKKPILALVPEGDCRNFTKEYRNSFICDPTDCNAISDAITCMIKQKKENTLVNRKLNNSFVDQFQRKVLTEKLKTVLEFAIKI